MISKKVKFAYILEPREYKLLPLVFIIRNFLIFFWSYYKKISQLLRGNYFLKDFSTPHLIFVFLIYVGLFNDSQFSIKVYL